MQPKLDSIQFILKGPQFNFSSHSLIKDTSHNPLHTNTPKALVSQWLTGSNKKGKGSIPPIVNQRHIVAGLSKLRTYMYVRGVVRTEGKI